MAHRKWNKIKQQPSLLPGPAVPGCSLVSFHFLWAILCPQAVQMNYNSKDKAVTYNNFGYYVFEAGRAEMPKFVDEVDSALSSRPKWPPAPWGATLIAPPRRRLLTP